MRKLFNLSLHRSGTSSVSKMLRPVCRSVHYTEQLSSPEILGLVDKKLEQFLTNPGDLYEELRPTIHANDAFGDLPYAAMPEVLMREHSSGIFLIIMRDVGDWIASCRGHVQGPLRPLEKLQYWSCGNRREVYLSGYSDEELQGFYLKHLLRVMKAATISGCELHVLWLNDPLIGEKIASLIECPPLELPHINASNDAYN